MCVTGYRSEDYPRLCPNLGPPSRLNFPRRNCHKKASQLCETDITTLVSHGDGHKVIHGVSLGVIHEVSLAIGLYKHVLVSDMGSVKGLVMRSVVESVMGSVFESVMCQS